MRLRLPELQVEEQEVRKVEVRKLKAELRSPYQVDGMRLRLQGAAGGLGKSGSKQGLKDGGEEDANMLL